MLVSPFYQTNKKTVLHQFQFLQKHQYEYIEDLPSKTENDVRHYHAHYFLNPSMELVETSQVNIKQLSIMTIHPSESELSLCSDM